MRLALLENASFSSLASDLLILSAFSALLLPLSLLIFSRTVRRARTLGTLSFY